MQGALLVTQAVKNYKKRNIGREERRKEERGRVDADADVHAMSKLPLPLLFWKLPLLLLFYKLPLLLLFICQ